MKRTGTLLAVIAFAINSTLGEFILSENKPINENNLRHIRQNAKSWKPMDINKNPFRDHTLSQLKQLGGNWGAESVQNRNTI